MTRPYSVDLRERMVRAVEAGASRRATAAGFEVSTSCVIKLLRRWRGKGTLEPDRIGGGRRSKLADHAERMQTLVAAAPDLTLAEVQRRLAAEEIRVSPSAISRFLKTRGLTRQRKTAHAAEQGRPDVAAARRAWREQQPALKAARLVFLDETWATTAMARRYRRARRGRRVVAAIPHGHCKTTTFLAALRHDGLAAPCVFDGAINGERFLADGAQALAPSLGPGNIVVTDTLAAHKVKGVRAAIAATGARLLYLPPYRPDFAPGSQHRPPRPVRSGAPIEHVFAKLEALLRTAAARSVEARWHAIGRFLDAFSPTECAHYLAHAGDGSL